MVKENIWKPRYNLTPAIAHGLMGVEAARAVVEHSPLPPSAEAELRRRARIRSTHYSTYIEGNRLTLAEAQKVIENKSTFHGRERDVKEVQNYWSALLRIEEWAARNAPFTEDLIRRLHALVHKGARAKPTPYRDGQNVIRDSASGAIVYLPPEAKDVPALMKSMVEWGRRAEKEGLPVPLIAALVHYLTPWLEYFVRTLAGVFTAAKNEALKYAVQETPSEPPEIRRLDRRARLVFALFSNSETITAPQVAKALGLSDRMARVILGKWVADGWLVVENSSNRSRAYGLSAIYRQYIDRLSAMNRKK